MNIDKIRERLALGTLWVIGIILAFAAFVAFDYCVGVLVRFVRGW